MEVAKPWEGMEMEAEEETEVSLRGRMPRQHDTIDDEESPIKITSSSTGSKVNDDDDRDTSSVDSESSSDDEEDKKRTNGNGVSHSENGNGNGDAKATNGHSKLDDRYVDFLEPETQDPIEHSPSFEFEANDLVLSQKEGIDVVEVNRQHVVEVNRQHVVEIEAVHDLPLPDSSSSNPHEENGTREETIEYMETRLRKKIEEEFKELYLNKLSDTPGEHEFYCPNCKACITKVLVREQELELKTSRDFRCTSCFSFLIPIGNWLFPRWSVEEARELDHEVPVSFGGLHEPLIDNKTPTVQPSVVTSVTTTTTTTTTTTNSDPVPSQVLEPNTEVSSRDFPVPTKPVVTSVTTKITESSEPIQPRPWSALIFGRKTRTAIKNQTPIPEEPIRVTEEISESNGVVKLHDDDRQPPARDFSETIVAAAATPIASGFEPGVKVEVTLPSHDLKGSLPDAIPPELHQSNEDLLIVKNIPAESQIDIVSVSKGNLPMLQEVVIHGGSNQSVAHPDLASQELPHTTVINMESRDTRLVLEPGSHKSWEIVKSIVYGGLVESITSLGIITSAASGDATTLNIVILALANLIGGLFVVAHNIWELRDDKSTVQSSFTYQMVDKYQEVLGRRENFYLHATFAILSFVVFGLVSPVAYGLAFRESDNKDLKLVAVGVASFVCIALLSIGKASVQRPNKYVKTVIYYLTIGFGVSGASYLAGELISKIINNIESSDLTQAIAFTGTSNAGWSSY